MPNPRLMCVWQAVSAQQGDSKRTAPKQLVKSVTASFATLQCVSWLEAAFDATFPGDSVDFSAYCVYVNRNLKEKTSPMLVMEEEIENRCWAKCQENFTIANYPWATDKTVKKLWRVFNRLCEPGSMPPVMAAEDVIWLTEQLAVHVGQSWISSDLQKDLTFESTLKFLHSHLLERATKAVAEHAVQEIHSWLVQEVVLAGWLWKRSKKQANWTAWLRRWVVLTPGTLSYFDGPKLKSKKGQVVINKDTIIADSPDLKRLGRRLTACFSIINRPSFQMDFAAMDDGDKNTWMIAMEEVQEASYHGTSPLQAMLTERRKARGESKASLDKVAAKRATRQLSVKATSRSPGTERKAKNIVRERINVKEPQARKSINEEQKEKIRAIFFKIDKDGNGMVDCAEFYQFLKTLGLEMPENEAQLIFDGIKEKKDGKITVDGFYDYFLKTILDSSAGTVEESRLRAAFLAADRDNTGTVDFREFAEYMWEKQRSVRVSRLLDTFEKMDKDHKGQVTFSNFREFAMKDPSVSNELILTEDELPDRPEDYLRHLYEEEDPKEVVDYLRNRWERFVSFRRPGASGDLVKYGKHGLIADVLPGDYNLIDLAAFSDLPPLVPKHATIKNLEWISPSGPGKLGRVIFPADFDGIIPIDIATSELLAYYGCSLANSTAINVSLMYRSAIQDFTYENQYIADYVASPDKQGGCGLEHHPFSHLDMPLDDAGGYFVIGKMTEDEELHLTAFKVPTRHCLYIPGGTIHTNDYLTGTWRTMLSDEAPVNQGHIMKRTGPGKDDMEKIIFKFKDS